MKLGEAKVKSARTGNGQQQAGQRATLGMVGEIGFAAMQADTSEGGRGFQGVLHVSLNLMWSRFDARSDCRLSIL